MAIPDDVRARMKAAGEHGLEEGLRVAQALLSQVQDMVQGVYLMPSYRRYDVVGELTRVLKTKQAVG
jgi:homocysteine S-methyltransferase